MSRFLLLFCAPLFFVACGPDYLFEKELPTANGAWSYADSLQFNFSITDTTGVYNLYLDVTHRPDYAYQNMYTRIVTDFPGDRTLEQVLSLELADKTGRWHGDCGGDACTVRIPLQERAFFDLRGEYALTVHQHMRKESLPGITAVGLAVEKTERTR